jgi:hypothetical protein
MDRKNETFHYYIRLQDAGGTLDWQMWSSRAAADYVRQILQHGDTYLIEEFGEACVTCATIQVTTACAGK